jgi:hypothetical protein
MSQREEALVGADGGVGAFKDRLSELRLRIRLDDQVNAAVRDSDVGSRPMRSVLWAPMPRFVLGSSGTFGRFSADSAAELARRSSLTDDSPPPGR